MFEATCLDMHGNSINEFMQWDVDQEIVIKLENCKDQNHIPDDLLRIEPNVHFSNVKRDKALVVRASDKIANDIIKVKVPNILLTEPYPLLIYVYYTNSNNPAAQSTIVYTEIPVRKRDEPHDYYYVENIERITAETIKGELQVGIDNTFVALKGELQTDINDFKKEVNWSLDDTELYVNNQLSGVHDRMQDIEDLFEETTTAVSDALEKVEIATSNVDYMKDFIAQSEKNKEVFYVENQTLYAENIEIAQNLKVGKFIWEHGAEGNMSLKWIGGGDS